MSIASTSTTVKFHQLPAGNLLHHYEPTRQIEGPIRSISWSKDGNWLALVPYTGQVEIVSVKEHLKLIHTVQDIDDPACVAFQNTTKKTVAVGTKNGSVLVYDIKSRNVKKRFPQANSAVRYIQFTAKDSHIVAACDSGEALIYNYAQNTLSGSFRVPRSSTITALRTNPFRRNFVVAGSEEGVVAIWDIHANKRKFFTGAHKAHVTGVCFSPTHSDLVVSTALDRQFCVYDMGANKCIGNIFVENSMTCVDFSPDGNFVIMASQKGNIYIYDNKNLNKPLYTFSGHKDSIEHLAYRKCGDYETSFSLPECRVETPKSEQTFEYDVKLTPAGVSNVSVQPEDSFMVALGLDKNNTAESLARNSPLTFVESQKKISMIGPTPVTSKIYERLIGDSHSMVTSTPENIDAVCSPIPGNKIPEIETPISENQLEKLVKGPIDDMKTELKHFSMEIMDKMYEIYANLMLNQVKSNLTMENNLKNLSICLNNTRTESSMSIVEENIFLKQRVAMLEQELAILKHKQNNNV